ncbi:50S ribosomal protein L10 [Candidatus Pacearchaeota archaeon]|nr:50S ribosomal protein L10 [Candidatus Pacearchaeota archaeon]
MRSKTKTRGVVKRERPIPEGKIKTVSELAGAIRENQTLMIASIKNLPGSQFQSIKHKLRGTAKVKVLKKSTMLRAIDGLKGSGKNLEELKDYIKEDCALLISNIDSFELSLLLSKNKSPAKARTGQEVPEDVTVEAGPTDLTPGPVISELGALGIPIQIKEGKIEIREAKVILKAGQKVTPAAEAIMSKLSIMPFRVGFEPLAAFDAKSGKVYSTLKIDSEGTLNALKEAYSRGLAFAVKIAYPVRETIPFILVKAKMNYDALAKLIKSDSQENK